jgi:hypothetical protein
VSAAFLEAIHADPWSEEFIDLPSLNARASEALESGVNRLRQIAAQQPKALRSSSLVVLGPPGAGKTHLFSRLRRRFGPRAVFVHIRPLVHAEMTPRFVLGETVRQLGYATQGLPQLDALVGSLLGHLNGADTTFPRAFLAEYQSRSETDREARLEDALEQVLGLWKEADESYLRRLLQAPFARGGQQRALLAWLSGRDCEVSQLQRIGATASLADELCLPALRTLSAVAALGAPIVVVFDQLENLIAAGGSDARLVAYGNLAAELVDTMRGLLLVHMALDTEWHRVIEPAFNLSQRSRVTMQRETLALPTAKEREELLRLWALRVPEPEEAFPWPLGPRRLERLLREPGLTPRMLLVEFRQALERGPDADVAEGAAASSAALSSSPQHDVERDPLVGLADEWRSRLAAARKLLEEAHEQRSSIEPSRLLDGLLACARFLPGVELSANPVKDAAQLVLRRGASTLKLALVHQAHPKSLGSILSKLTGLAPKQEIIAVRERAHELPPTWKDTRTKRAALLATERATWVDLEPEDTAGLLALDELLQCARSGDVADDHGRPLTEEVVAGWVRDNLRVENWAIARALVQRDGGAERAVDTRAEDESLTATRVAEPSGVALAVLRRLRLASFDRLVRETTRLEPKATRASILAELEAAGGSVRWFGRSIVCERSDR